MARVHVVLVRPQHPENVGAAARAIRNAGLERLVLVDPGDFRTVECWRTAWGSHDVLEALVTHPSLEEALAGCAYSAGLTARREATTVDVRDMAAEVAGLGREETACLVFGPETSGLTLEELSRCSRRVTIPSHHEQPSLNLSQAVMVAAYEVFRRREAAAPPAPARTATHEEVSQALALLGEGLRAISALPDSRSERDLRDWEALLRRADPTPRELRLLEHASRKMIRSAH